jgi:hypothetical protein
MGTLYMNAGEVGVAAALLRAGARILVVGGHAILFRGHLRTVKDLDLFILPSPENAAKVAAALGSLGMTISLEVERGFAQPHKKIPLPPPYAGVELLTSIGGVEFAAAEAEASFGFTQDARIPVLSVRHLVASKIARGEPKDIADIEGLRNVCAV